ncbi:hypothetical protein GPECTOR_28g800 [Gonium pectorale]|uniref:Uncharacterized protein n=1 Tax=Gonium pectorale TaxID=33097 RepID=A0A150GF35_GONPE|nr:hypothetical protein GPECTOR_28g800 [Gonium pectorale]|eukprot:KXZ48393.1 hypothetical protein GPECTOR_28g800 [Gonium pectorale]
MNAQAAMHWLERALASISQQELAVALSLGPHGLDHLVIDEANQPVIANSGDVILSATSPDDALGALLLRLATDSSASLGDATKRVLLMVTAGLRQFIRSGLHPLAFQSALAAQVLECVVPAAVLHVPLAPLLGGGGGGGAPAEQEREQAGEATQALQALIATHLGGKVGGPAASHHIADVLREAVELQLRAAARAGVSAAEALAALRDAPPLARLTGPPPEASVLLPGVLLTEAPLNPGAAAACGLDRQVRPAFLALTCPLDGEALGCVPPAGGDGDGYGSGDGHGVVVDSERGRQAAARSAAELLRAKVAAMAARGVKLLLLCGRGGQEGAQEGEAGEGQECLVFVAGGGAFESLLELQLRELMDAAQRGVGPLPEVPASEEEEEEEEEEGVEHGGGEDGGRERGGVWSAADLALAAAAEAPAKSQLLASLRVLHAMAAVVPLVLAGGGSAAAGGGGSGSGGGPSVASGPAWRAQHEALTQVTALREAQGRALAADCVSCSGLVVPAAAYSFHRRALPGLRTGLATTDITTATSAASPDGGTVPGVRCLGAADAAGSTADFAPSGRSAEAAAGIGAEATGGGGGRGGGGAGRGDLASTAAADGGKRGSAYVCERPVLGGHAFVVADAVGAGVVEAAAVVASAWSAAVEVLVQVLRIDGAVLAASRPTGRGAGGSGAALRVAGPPAAAAPRARRGGVQGDASSGSDDEDGDESSSGSSSGGE